MYQCWDCIHRFDCPDYRQESSNDYCPNYEKEEEE